ncbi:ABC transporter permease [Lacrimispora sp. NSJ-141]|uniref:ABC transporter permease n=1 Tax=Lientehia hominis TaxID=2897778 RepID=A0AAP2RL69_9FIRM|nr:ABC transporter permease [Lientehia hominis]MCD2493743.1 ABC transporter permease [Lientehia hominis]
MKKETEEKRGSSSQKTIALIVNNHEFTIAAFLILMIIVFSVVTDTFLSVKNVLNILNLTSITFIMAAGMTLVMICGGIDLSVAAIMTLAGIISTSLIAKGLNLWLVIFLTIMVGVMAGTVNGIMTAKIGIVDFIATLAMQLVCHGITFTWTGGYPIFENLTGEFKFWGQGRVLGIPFLVILALIVFVVIHILLSKCRFGSKLYATGGNREASRLSGINVVKMKVMTFVISGGLAAFAGILMASRLGSGQPTAGETSLNDVIGSTILGGTSPNGGVGKVYGTLMGAIIFTVITNGLTHLQVNSYVQEIVRGIIILLALALNSYRERLGAR